MSLKRYIQGHRKGKEAHRIERDALKDPFLYEALEGLDDVPEDHFKRILELQKSISKAAAPANRPWLRWSVAASILLLISFGGYLFLTDTEEERAPLISQNIEKDAPVDLLKEMPESDVQVEPTEIAQEQMAREDLSQRSRTADRNSQEKQLLPATVVSAPTIALQAEQEATLAEELVVVDMEAKKVSDKLATVADEKASRDSVRGYAQATISGIVTDQSGSPLVGAYIMQNGTNIGATSNIDGRFEMKIDTTRNLNVNYIGFQTQDIPATQFSNAMNIAMVEDQSQLSEVVVTAHGVTRRSVTTGAATQVSTKEVGSKPEPMIGKKAYEQYIESNMVHPVDEQGKKIKGKVKLSFYIDSQGRPINITVEKGLNNAADAEAIRLIKGGANWTLSSEKVEWTISF